MQQPSTMRVFVHHVVSLPALFGWLSCALLPQERVSPLPFLAPGSPRTFPFTPLTPPPTTAPPHTHTPYSHQAHAALAAPSPLPPAQPSNPLLSSAPSRTKSRLTRPSSKTDNNNNHNKTKTTPHHHHHTTPPTPTPSPRPWPAPASMPSTSPPPPALPAGGFLAGPPPAPRT